MSRIGDLISGILGKEENTEETEKRPCRNCLPSCPYAPGACAECQPCKERLLDRIWNAEHEEEYSARYEIVPETDQTVGTETCPFCGGQNPVTAAVCDYCGSQLREPSGKIRAVAAAYGVSVGTYLQGLDNGVCLTASAKKKEDEEKAAAAASAAPYAPVGYAAHTVRPEPVRPEPKRPGLGRPGQGRPGRPERPGRLKRPGNAGHSTNAGHNTNAMHNGNAMHPGRPSAARPQQMQGKGPGRNTRGGSRGGGSHR